MKSRLMFFKKENVLATNSPALLTHFNTQHN